MVEITRQDWMLFRERISLWQERYMEQLVKKYIKLLNESGNASDRFWKLEKRINKDKKHPGVIIEINKSEAVWDIATLLQKKVIKPEDLEGFSEELIEDVKRIAGI